MNIELREVLKNFCEETLRVLVSQLNELEQYESLLKSLQQKYEEQGIPFNIEAVQQGKYCIIMAIKGCLERLNR